MTKFKKLDLSKINTYSINDRPSKVHLDSFGGILNSDASFADFINNLPKILAADDLQKFINSYAKAIREKGQITCMLGAHVIKVGLSPLVIDALKRGWISHLAVNGACVIHDVEVALWGKTSEDVAQGIDDGSFGMAQEPTAFINNAVKDGAQKFGYGESVARALKKSNGPFLDSSILYQSFINNIPLTVHSAIGTEIIHQHPSADGAAIGDTSWTDFQIFCEQISHLNQNGIVLNIGSAVIMPEIFLKALTVVRNLGHDAFGFTTATFDMIRHYRPTVNVMQRPTQRSGKGYYFIGHHEIMIPLLFAALKSKNL